MTTDLQQPRKLQRRQPLRAARGSDATWLTYYLDEHGMPQYISAIPMEKRRAEKLCRAAQHYYRGRFVVQITETPPNDQVLPRLDSAGGAQQQESNDR